MSGGVKMFKKKKVTDPENFTAQDNLTEEEKVYTRQRIEDDE